ncbi:ankyrin repeat and SOCS box protein 15 isoform X2 [Mustelus asterias]
MDANTDSVNEQLTQYAIQLSIEESIEANNNSTSQYHERFLPPSQENRQIVESIRQGEIFTLQQLIKHKFAFDEADEKGWFPLHEAAVQPIQQVLEIVLDSSYKTIWQQRTEDGNTPLTLAATAGILGNVQALLEKRICPNVTNDRGETPLLIGGDVLAQADDGASILFEAAEGGNPDCITVLLEYGANPNEPDNAGHLPIHRAAQKGHYLALKLLILITRKSAIKKSGINPIHSAADSGSAQCLELLIESGFDVNALLDEEIAASYDDKRRTALFIAVSNNDIACTELLLKAGAIPNRDPLSCLLVAVRAGNHELVRLLLHHGANVNSYFLLVNDTYFPTAIQYAINDEMMLRLLLNNGYNVQICFDCVHSESSGRFLPWSMIEPRSYITSFCEFITVSWLSHLVGRVVRVLIDYVDYVSFCVKLKPILEKQKEWPEICDIIENPRRLKHLCRLKIRKHMGQRRLQDLTCLALLPLPPLLMDYILYKEYDLYGRGLDSQ